MNITWINLLCAGTSLFETSEKELAMLHQHSYETVLGGVICWGIILFIISHKRKKYKKSSYYQITKNKYSKVRFNKGLRGEYETYKKLKYLEREGVKFLFNLYLPKEDGETSEIDVLMLCSNGIYVLESKNYSGWIFGNEKQKYWTQTLPRGYGFSSKKQFLNPIIQNEGHIKCLKNIVDQNVDMRSIIVFSERCTFKDLTLKREEIKVVNRYELVYAIKDLMKYTPENPLSQEQIEELYEKLYPYTQVTDEEKQQHIKNAKKIYVPKQKKVEKNEEFKDIENLSNSLEVKEEKERFMQISENLCPKCGGKLVKRIARTGKYAGNHFWGCSNYPNCRYIKNQE